MDERRIDWKLVVFYTGCLCFSLGFWYVVGAGCNAFIDAVRAGSIDFAPVCRGLVEAGGFADHATCVQAFLDAPSA